MPLTTSEDYLPSLTQLEQSLTSLHHLLHDFTSSYPTHFYPLIEPLLHHTQIELSSLGPLITRVVREKTGLDQVLQACMELRKNMTAMCDNKKIRADMDIITKSKLDDRTSQKLVDLRKIFESSLVRIEKQSIRREDTARRIREGTMRNMNGVNALTSPLSYRTAMSTPASASSSFSSPPTSKSILTSSLDLSVVSESIGDGSVGVFSPVKSSALPTRLVTRTGATDYQAMDESRRKREIEIEDERKRIEMETPNNSRPIYQSYQPTSNVSPSPLPTHSSSLLSSATPINARAFRANTNSNFTSPAYNLLDSNSNQQLSLAHLQ